METRNILCTRGKRNCSKSRKEISGLLTREVWEYSAIGWGWVRPLSEHCLKIAKTEKMLNSPKIIVCPVD